MVGTLPNPNEKLTVIKKVVLSPQACLESLPSVCPHVHLEMSRLRECLVTNFTLERTFSRVEHHVPLKIAIVMERLAANSTLVLGYCG